MTTLIGFDWTQYSLARINLVASGRGNCGDILPKSDDETIKLFRESLKGRLTDDDKEMLSIYDELEQCCENTLGFELLNYYRTEGHTPVDPKGTFPVRYIMIHDAHHVLLNAATSDQGELNVLAFECGANQKGQKAESLIPVMAQSRVFPECDLLQVAKHWEIGCNAMSGLLETFDLRQWMRCSVNLVQSTYNIGLFNG
jgi:hypothetical protein